MYGPHIIVTTLYRYTCRQTLLTQVEGVAGPLEHVLQPLQGRVVLSMKGDVRVSLPWHYAPYFQGSCRTRGEKEVLMTGGVQVML